MKIITWVVAISARFGALTSCSPNSDISEHGNAIDQLKLSPQYQDLIAHMKSKEYVEFSETVSRVVEGKTVYVSPILIDGNSEGSLLFTRLDGNRGFMILKRSAIREFNDTLSFRVSLWTNEELFGVRHRVNGKKDETIITLNDQLPSNRAPSWLECTNICIETAWSACTNDPWCDIECGWIHEICIAAIATSCGAWCAGDTTHELPN